MSRIVRFIQVALCLCGLLQAGCGGSGSSIFSNLSQQTLSLLPASTVMLQVINNVKASDGTPYTVELEITIDGAPQTLTALPTISTRYVLGYCPSEIRTVTERWLDTKGRVVGGRDYSGVNVNSFPAGSFGCGSTLMWQLSAQEVKTESL